MCEHIGIFHRLYVILQICDNTIPQTIIFMKATKNSTPPDAYKGGHDVPMASVTAPQEKTNDNAAMPVNLFALTDHDFICEVIADTDAKRIYESYLRFTRDILTLYHGQHSNDEIHSALIIAEDHLTNTLGGHRGRERGVHQICRTRHQVSQTIHTASCREMRVGWRCREERRC